MLDGVASVPRDEWNALVARRVAVPGMGVARLARGGGLRRRRETGWLPRPLVLRESGPARRGVPALREAPQRGRVRLRLGLGGRRPARRASTTTRSCWSACRSRPSTGARFLTAPGADRARAIAQLGAGLRELCDAPPALRRARELLPARRVATRSRSAATCCASASSTTGATRATRPSTTTSAACAASAATR